MSSPGDWMSSNGAKDAPDAAITMDSEHDLINSLPDECLVHILSRVVQETPPETRDCGYPRNTKPDYAVRHPIHCAPVCRRWAALVDGSVTHLHFQGVPEFFYTPSVPLGRNLPRFSALRSLHFINLSLEDKMPSILRALSLGACPLLNSFRHTHSWKNSRGLDGAGLAGALRHCLLLQCLDVRVEHMQDDRDLRLAIRRLSLLESLSLDLFFWPSTCKGLHDVHEGMSQLKSLTIKGNEGLIPAVSSAVGLPLLEKLALFFNASRELPASLGRLSALRSLDLRVFGLRSIPASLGQLQNLRSLDIRHGQMLFLPESLGQLSALQSLSVYCCYELREVPTSIGSLSALKTLFLEGCDSLHSLPDTLGMLTSLELLTIKKCRHFNSLPETLGSLQRLSVLKISSILLTSIPESIGLLTGLRSLKVWSRPELPASVWRLTGLESLNLHCKVAVPEALGDFRSLTELKLHDCLQIPESLGQLQALVSLTLSYCELSYVPEWVERLTGLQTLNFHTGDLSHVPEWFLRMPSLQRLYVTAECGMNEAHPSMAVLHKLFAQGVDVEREFGFDSL